MQSELKWASLHNHTHLGSLLDGLSKPEELIEKAIKSNIIAISITDHGTMNAVVKAQKAKKKVIEKLKGTEYEDAAKSIKIINGCEMYVRVEDNINRHLVVLAKNLSGYKALIKMVSEATKVENKWRKPRLSIEQMARFNKDKNLISFSGHPGSDLADEIFANIKGAYNASTEEEVRSYIHPQCRKKLLAKADEYIQAFGKDNFFLEKQLFDMKRMPAQIVIAKAMDWLSKETGLRIVSTCDSHYVLQSHAEDQRILLCNSLKTTLPKIYKQLASDEDDVGMGGFFKTDKYYLPTAEEIYNLHLEEEIKCSLEIAELIDSYDLSNPPVIPNFACPDGLSADEYMRQLCRQGWTEKLTFSSKEMKSEYANRVKYELEVLQGAKLSDYFLIVQDFIRHVKQEGYLVGPGRGCLSPYTKILTKYGRVKNISDIEIGEYVYTIDGTLKKVLNKFKYNNNEELLNIKCYYGDREGVSLTKDHKVLVEKAIFNKKTQRYNRPVGKLNWIRADQIQKNDWVFYPNIQYNYIEDFVFDLSILCDNYLLEYDDNYVYQYRINHCVKQLVHKNNRFIKFDNDFCKLLGYFTGDGCIRQSQDYNAYFSFHINHTDKIEFIKNVLIKYDFDISERSQLKTNSHQIIVNSKFFNRLIKYLFYNYRFTSITKHVPSEIFNLSIDNIRSYLDGYIWADGYISDKCNTSNTKSISLDLSYQIKFLFNLVGVCCSINHYQTNDKRCKINNIVHSVIFSNKVPKNQHIERVKDGMLLRVSNIETCNSDDVYDLEIEDNHNYCTSSFIVHNSGAGSLVGYLLGITAVDPIPPGLIFERFYNAGRNSPGKISLPDYDIDIQGAAAETTIRYLKDKYGHENVGQIANYGRLMGRACLKDVLRAHEACDFQTMNKICSFLVDESAIADELQEMKEEEGESSIIKWALENNAKELSEWAWLDEKTGDINGPYGKYFSQAIRLEGTYRQRGKHAAGYVIYPGPVTDICPVTYNKDGDCEIDFDMHDVEYTGGVKMDILKVWVLDKIADCADSIRNEFLLEEDL